MKKFTLLTAFLSGILFAPFFFSEENIPEVSHASAAILNILPVQTEEKVSEKTSEEVSKLCEKDELFTGFSEEEKAIIAEAWSGVPCELLANLKSVSIYDDMSKPRALAGASSLRLRSDIFSLPEAKKVILHETGHLVDLGGLTSTEYAEESAFQDGSLPVFADDPSVEFYSISWRKNDSWNLDTRVDDFLSRYGATDPFEDFAEGFLFYVEYGSAFRELAAENDHIAQKYDFYKNRVFAGEEFAGEDIVMTAERPWDATRI